MVTKNSSIKKNPKPVQPELTPAVKELQATATPVTTRRTQAESAAEYRERIKRTDPELIAARIKYAKLLLKVHAVRTQRKIVLRADGFEFSGRPNGVTPYDEVTGYVGSMDWCLLQPKDRLPALEALALEEMNVPGGVLYRVIEPFGGLDAEWVFLNVKHSIGRAKPIATQWAARVF